MFFIGDIFLVEMIDMHLLFAMRSPEQLQKISLELIAVVGDMFARVLSNQQHLPHMGFALNMTTLIS
jgi:5-carboxymethyl-2-hydroxymuconate isomerase